MTQLNVAVHGAAGRMGRRVVALGYADAGVRIVAALENAGHPRLGTDIGILSGVGPLEVPVSTTLPDNVQVVIDFSVPEAATLISQVCAERGTPLVVATTGLSRQQQERCKLVSQRVPLVMAPNMSLAVNLAAELCGVAASVLKKHAPDSHVEIIERHHGYKEDAPSGTALQLGQLIARIMGQTEHRHGRQGRPGVRQAGEIGYHAVRAGDHPGEHTILFGLLGETLEIRVSAIDRDGYARGALAAAKFVHHKPPGAYSMKDVVGL